MKRHRRELVRSEHVGLWQAGQRRHTGEHWHTFLVGFSTFAVNIMHKVGDTSFRRSHGSKIDFCLRTSGISEPNRGVLNIGETGTCSAKNPNVRST